MTVYRYPQSKVVDEITFRKSEGGHLRAYMHAAGGTQNEVLNRIICDLADRKWHVTPFSLGTKPMVEVHGFGNKEESLLSLAQDKNWVSGEREQIVEKVEKPGLWEQIKKRSLAASGAFYLIGDASFSTYGYKGGSGLNTVGGLMYGAGTLSLLGGGRKDQSDLQIRDIAKQMRDHLKAMDPKLLKDCSLESITEDHKKGLIQKADDLFRRYPSELMNLFFAGAGLCIAAAAYKGHIAPKFLASAEHHSDMRKSVAEVFRRSHKAVKTAHPETVFSKADMLQKYTGLKDKLKVMHKREGWLDIGLGGMTTLSGLFAMMVKEKARDPDMPEPHGMAAAWEWIREKPLAVAGMGYMVSTMCHAVSTGIAWNYASNERRKSVGFRAVFVASNIIAEILLAISSKGHGEGVKSDKNVDNTIIALGAELIAKQPVAAHEGLIDYVARFLGREDTLALKDDEAKNLLRQQVELMRKNPWAVAVSRNQESGIGNQELAAPKKFTAALKEPMPGWEAKMAAQAAHGVGMPQVSA